MLKVKLEGKKGIAEIEASGTLPELCADVTALLSVIYDGLNGEETKRMFVCAVKHMADDELFTKTTEEMKEKVDKLKGKEKKEEESKEEDFEQLKEILKMLKDIIQ